MGWAETWSDILSGGNQLWKVDNVDAKRIALEHILQHHHHHSNEPMHILCPLSGDDPFVHYAWSRGHIVTAIDIVPDALKAMRKLFGSDTDQCQWKKMKTNMAVLRLFGNTRAKG